MATEQGLLQEVKSDSPSHVCHTAIHTRAQGTVCRAWEEPVSVSTRPPKQQGLSSRKAAFGAESIVGAEPGAHEDAGGGNRTPVGLRHGQLSPRLRSDVAAPTAQTERGSSGPSVPRDVCAAGHRQRPHVDTGLERCLLVLTTNRNACFDEMPRCLGGSLSSGLRLQAFV